MKKNKGTPIHPAKENIYQSESAVNTWARNASVAFWEKDISLLAIFNKMSTKLWTIISRMPSPLMKLLCSLLMSL